MLFNAIILSALLLMSREVVADEAAADQPPPVPSVENNPLKDEQDYLVEPDPSTSSQPEPHEEENPQEGIADVFSQDQGDRFQSKNNKGVEFIPVK